jgi:excinuclease ABC subunit B
MGRAARNVRGRVILYADRMTGSMERAIGETNRRRKKQTAYNKKHHITPTTIQKNIASIVDHEINPESVKVEAIALGSPQELLRHIKLKEKEMQSASNALDFERALLLRDEIRELRRLME